MSKFKNRLIGIVAGTLLAVGTAGCNSGPQKEFFGAPVGATEKKVFTSPPLFYLTPIHGGQYHFKKIIDSNTNETIGYDILYHRWTEVVGLKIGDDKQRIIIPGAKNMGIEQDFILKDRFKIRYELNGQKRLDKYHIGFAGDQCKFAEQYFFNEKGEKIKVK